MFVNRSAKLAPTCPATYHSAAERSVHTIPTRTGTRIHIHHRPVCAIVAPAPNAAALGEGYHRSVKPVGRLVGRIPPLNSILAHCLCVSIFLWPVKYRAWESVILKRRMFSMESSSVSIDFSTPQHLPP